MKIVIISDTHERHEALGRLSGDLLIHCGDMFNLFDPGGLDIPALDRWFGEQGFDQVLCVGGNHDLGLEITLEHTLQPFTNAIVLQDNSHTYQGRMFWGAPWTPDLPHHAFYRSDQELAEKWSQIPDDVDVLITHTPPRSVLDVSSAGFELGCPWLLQATQRVAPALHCFGHVHHSRGWQEQGPTLFVNASSTQRTHSGLLPPMVFEV